MTTRRKECGSQSPRGFTIIELLISLVVFGAVMTMAFSFLQVQNKGFRKGLDYMSTMQTLRYAVGVLEQEEVGGFGRTGGRRQTNCEC